MVDLSIDFCGLKFPNPFTVAASPCSGSAEMVARAFEAGWGAAVLKTAAAENGSAGPSYPAVSALSYQGKQLMALQNIDLFPRQHIDAVEKNVAMLKKQFPNNIVIASITGRKKHDWQSLAKRLEAAGADALECSFSFLAALPAGSRRKAPQDDLAVLERVTQWVKEAAGHIPVIIKLSSQFPHLARVALAVKNSGAAGITAISPLPSLIGINLQNFIPYPDIDGLSTFGSLSGRAIKPVSLRCVAEIAKVVDIEISASGGLSTWQDAIEFILVGAKNLQIATEIMHSGFGIIKQLQEDVSAYLAQMGFASLQELVGKSLPFIEEQRKLPATRGMICGINEEACVKCTSCYIACRDGGHQAIELDINSLPVINRKKCVGCGLCQAICPVPGCIQIKPVRVVEVS